MRTASQHEQNGVLDARERLGLGTKRNPDRGKHEHDKREVSQENRDKNSDSDRRGRPLMCSHCVTITTSLQPRQRGWTIRVEDRLKPFENTQTQEALP
jgi:hypothetical protein